jgi:transcriptional regulator with XRE-family HTH domain
VVLYKKFADLLGKSNKTSYQVAKETGIAQSVLSDWKTGRSKPKFDKLLILAKYFGVPVEYFAEENKEDAEKW